MTLITDYDLYFGPGRHPVDALKIWQGGLGVWGGIFLGAVVGAWIVHRAGASVYLFMDAVAPGLLLAQGIGRWGNYFNQELYGKPTSLPWGLKIDFEHRVPQYLGVGFVCALVALALRIL